MTDIKELSKKVAKEMNWRMDEMTLETFSTSFLAAYLKEQEPIHQWRKRTNDHWFDASQVEAYSRVDQYYEARTLFTAPPEPAPQQSDRDRQHEHTMNQFKEVCHGRNCAANKAQPTHSNECKADHDKATACASPSSEEVQWRNIKHVVKTLADWAFGSKDDPRWGTAWIAMVSGLTAKDGPTFNLESLTPKQKE